MICVLKILGILSYYYIKIDINNVSKLNILFYTSNTQHIDCYIISL